MPRALILAPQRRSSGVVEADDDGPVRDKGADQQTKQAAREPAARPAVAVENPVVVGEVRVLVEAGDAQGGGDGAPPGAEDGAGDQHQHVLPGRCGEAPLNGCIQAGQSGRYEPA